MRIIIHTIQNETIATDPDILLQNATTLPIDIMHVVIYARVH